VSNFGGLALLGAEGPGSCDDAETLYLIAETDRRVVLEVLAALNYVPLREDVLSAEYDGASDACAMPIRRTRRPGSSDISTTCEVSAA
jgi:hypothetical protein